MGIAASLVTVHVGEEVALLVDLEVDQGVRWPAFSGSMRYEPRRCFIWVLAGRISGESCVSVVGECSFGQPLLTGFVTGSLFMHSIQPLSWAIRKRP